MSTPALPALAVDGLGLKIGGARILADVGFTVGAGEMIGVIGPNGAGKTTLFNLVSGLMRPTAGSITLNGRDITAAPIHHRSRAGLGRTFQTSNLFPRLSVLENVRLAAQAKLGGNFSILRFPAASDEASRIARGTIAEVGLTGKLATAAGDLSHGEKRKVEIAVLLATDPAVVLLDEPMAGVASGDVPSLTAIIRDLHRERGCTVMMVEHHMDVVLGLVDRVAVMHHGSLLALDSPDAVMANPVVQSAYLGEPV
ncbi:ABC transporter ATP-binding protein [Arthrobacter sp. PM3]|uniref:ABC transporter ATP-binding protein n=1 Tax=Arthrobacter sp. PM3 TaxID=2017685 RepID=UPI000E109644|nr:ABC transporter ATP-binding protein [Arthrobacter sp. PM3]AXJ10602.1 ABC transporter ATP-binding protein [Arthrobacter sp. PM3]